MKNRFLYLAALAFVSGTLVLAAPETSLAAPETSEAADMADTAEDSECGVDIDLQEELLADELISQGPAVVREARLLAQTEAEEQAAAEAESSAARRQNVVNYALQFIGGKYRAGGNDPNTGADCSGFVKYIMQNGAGVSMNRSSSSQASQGVQISVDQMQPGDLLFYSNGSRINHVAMYIGDGQIVHASTYATGIKISPWNYRNPVRIMNILG